MHAAQTAQSGGAHIELKPADAHNRRRTHRRRTLVRHGCKRFCSVGDVLSEIGALRCSIVTSACLSMPSIVRMSVACIESNMFELTKSARAEQSKAGIRDEPAVRLYLLCCCLLLFGRS